MCSGPHVVPSVSQHPSQGETRPLRTFLCCLLLSAFLWVCLCWNDLITLQVRPWLERIVGREQVVTAFL